jgi:hypothetical protein
MLAGVMPRKKHAAGSVALAVASCVFWVALNGREPMTVAFSIKSFAGGLAKALDAWNANPTPTNATTTKTAVAGATRWKLDFDWLSRDTSSPNPAARHESPQKTAEPRQTMTVTRNVR